MEKTAINCHPCVSMGASPYARGGFYGTVPDIAPVRLIPVRTGRISFVYSPALRIRVHPRTHGADRFSPGGFSPPRVHPRTHGADTKFLKEFSMADALSIPIILDLYDKFSMYYFFEMYFCG